MIPKKTVCVLLCAALLALCACAAVPSEKSSGPFALVTDMLGREVRIEKQPERIVSLTPANTEIVYALGLGDRLAAVDNYSDYPADAAKLPKIGDYSQPNTEAIAALQPDLVLAGDVLQQEAIDRLEELGFCVVATEVKTLSELPDSIHLVGQATGAKEQAETLALQYSETLDRVRDALPQDADAHKPRVYWAITFGEWGDFTAGPGSFPHEILAIAGGENVAGTSEYAWPMYSAEQLLLDDPDVILIPGNESMRESFLEFENYASLRAVKEGRVYCVPEAVVSRPGPRLAEAADLVYGLLYDEG